MITDLEHLTTLEQELTDRYNRLEQRFEIVLNILVEITAKLKETEND